MTKNTTNQLINENINKNLEDKNFTLDVRVVSILHIFTQKLKRKKKNCCHLGPLVNLLNMRNDSIGVEFTFRENYICAMQ